MRQIPLTKGYVALVDDEDYERVATLRWHVNLSNRTAYAEHGLVSPRTTIQMHRLIINAPPGIGVDHVNGNGLDNRRANLRLATQRQNLRNQRPQIGRSSRFKGVSWSRQRGKWHADIYIDGRHKFLGAFDSEIEAASAYDAAAREFYGPFARPNLEAVA